VKEASGRRGGDNLTKEEIDQILDEEKQSGGSKCAVAARTTAAVVGTSAAALITYEVVKRLVGAVLLITPAAPAGVLLEVTP
jgi:hypothetical protein